MSEALDDQQIWVPVVNPDEALDANCVGQIPEMFFPGHGGSTSAAKFICSRCPIIDSCLEGALQSEPQGKSSHRAGVFGGLSAYERNQVAVVFRDEGTAKGWEKVNKLRTESFRSAHRLYRSRAGLTISLQDDMFDGPFEADAPKLIAS